jgi:hypothetical protein
MKSGRANDSCGPHRATAPKRPTSVASIR